MVNRVCFGSNPRSGRMICAGIIIIALGLIYQARKKDLSTVSSVIWTPRPRCLKSFWSSAEPLLVGLLFLLLVLQLVLEKKLKSWSWSCSDFTLVMRLKSSVWVFGDKLTADLHVGPTVHIDRVRQACCVHCGCQHHRLEGTTCTCQVAHGLSTQRWQYIWRVNRTMTG